MQHIVNALLWLDLHWGTIVLCASPIVLVFSKFWRTRSPALQAKYPRIGHAADLLEQLFLALRPLLPTFFKLCTGKDWIAGPSALPPEVSTKVEVKPPIVLGCLLIVCLLSGLSMHGCGWPSPLPASHATTSFVQGVR